MGPTQRGIRTLRARYMYRLVNNRVGGVRAARPFDVGGEIVRTAKERDALTEKYHNHGAQGSTYLRARPDARRKSEICQPVSIGCA